MKKIKKASGEKSFFFNDVVYLIKQSGAIFLLFCIVIFTVLYPSHVYFKLFFCIAALFLCNIIKYLDKTALWLGIFSVLYSLFVLVQGKATSYAELGSYLIGPISFYCFGQYIVDKSITQMRIISFILITIVLFGFNAYISAIKDAQAFGVINLAREMTLEGRENILSATLFGVNVSLGFVGLTAFMALDRPLSSLRAWIFLSISILSVYTVLHLVNRTGIVVLIICSLIVVLYLSKNNFYRLLGGLGLFAILIYMLIYTGVLSQEYFDAYKYRENDIAISMGSEGGRLFRWEDGLERLFINPFGWDTYSYKYVHNMWLDVAHISGILPFFSLMIATIKSTRVTIKLFTIKNNKLITIFIGLNVCFFVTAFVEPIIEGMSTYFYLYCMVWGLQQRYYILNYRSS